MSKREKVVPHARTQGGGRRRFRDGAVGAVLGAVAAYFGDPDSGRRRRHVTRDRFLGLLRRTGRRAERAGRGVAAEAYGVSQKVQHLREEEKEFDDVTLARKVESEIFRDPHVPKGQINVDAADGVVSLRGQVDRPELIDELVERTRKVQGVRDVENLLHLPGSPAPMHF
jgi:osmotically-inducible protein OsmY